MKEIDIKKAAVVETITPKLIKIGADVIAEPLTQAINYCLRQGIFPDHVKIASVNPVNKEKPDKSDILNYRPVSILNTENLAQLSHILFKKYIANNLIILQIPFLELHELSKVISIEQRKN